MPIRVGMVSLGCSKNLVDSERMLAKLRAHGYQLVTEPGEAEIAIVNTCGFIQSAKEEAIETILELGALKKDGTLKKIILTGCLTERYKEEAAELFTEADAVIGIGDNRDIVDILDHVLAGERVVRFGKKSDAEMKGDRIITTLPFFAYLKQLYLLRHPCHPWPVPQRPHGGCAGRGTLAGRASRDRTGGNCTGYHPVRLRPVRQVQTAGTAPGAVSHRRHPLGACAVLLSGTHLDLPIQHCDGEILRRMHRPGNEETLRKTIAHIRERVPDITLRTTLITGFPGETKEQFNRLGDFVQDMQFDHLGCFAYSEEEGTKAAEFEDQIDEDVRAHRADIIMEQQAEVSAAKNAAKLGKRMTAVVEGYDKYAGCYFGRTAADAPDIDGKVFIKSDSRLRLGQYITVEVFDTMDYDLLAEEVTDEPAE